MVTHQTKPIGGAMIGGCHGVQELAKVYQDKFGNRSGH